MTKALIDGYDTSRTGRNSQTSQQEIWGVRFAVVVALDKIHSMETVTLQDLERDPGGFLDRVEAGEAPS